MAPYLSLGKTLKKWPPFGVNLTVFILGSDSRPAETEWECDRQPQCECDFKHRSWNEVLDEEGEALLSILEFPSKVCACACVCMCVCMRVCVCVCVCVHRG